jgi:peptidylprolyl isomerase
LVFPLFLKGLVVRRLVVSLLVASIAFAGSLAFVGIAAPAGARTATRTASLAKVTVTGAVGQEPKVTFSAPFSTKASVHRQLQAGTGAKLTKGAKITFNFVVVDGRTGTPFESTFGKTPGAIVLDKKKALPGLVGGILGKTVGSRQLIAIAPKEGLTANSSLQSAGIKKSDTLLFVVDVTGVRTVMKRATGTPVPPVAGLPTVKLAADGSPTITVPATPAPTALIAQPLIKGTGPVVAAGQTITVQYTGVIWNTGKKFDSSWDRGASIDFAIGVKQVIPGWDAGLVGQTVGSQVLLVVPPDQGYGAAGQPNGGISGTDTLVFVVDILDAF